jgi:hypothetical protein
MGDKLLRRIVSDQDSLLSTTFHYDAQNRLTELIDSNRQGHIWQTAIEYNAAGNAVKFTTHYQYHPRSVSNVYTDSLVYENGRVTKKLYKYTYPNNSTGFQVTHTYAYDTKGRLITDFYGNSNRPDEVNAYTTFSYDADDNIVAIHEFNKSSGVMDSAQTITLTYNSDKNPYNSIGLMLYYVIGEQFVGDYHLLLLGKHNKTKVVFKRRNFEGLKTEYAYEYNADGLPNKWILSRSWVGRASEPVTFDFYYQ